MPGTEQLSSYMTLHEWEKEGVDGADSDDEAISDCEAAFIEREEAEDLPRRQIRLTKVIRKVVPTLRLGMRYFAPSFLLPRSQDPKRLHPTAWLGTSNAKHQSPNVSRLTQMTMLLQTVFVVLLPFWSYYITPVSLVSHGKSMTAGPLPDIK